MAIGFVWIGKMVPAFLLIALPAGGGVPVAGGDPGAGRPLLEAARSLSLPPDRTVDSAPSPSLSAPATASGLVSFWNRHRWHIMTTFLMTEADYQYDRAVGTSRQPLLFGEAPGLDRRADRWLYDAQASPDFIAAHKTMIMRGVSLGAILAADGTHLAAVADDLIGLIEAEKFTTASTGLVKNVFGRHRPALDRDNASTIGLATFEARQRAEGGRLSFYSEATAQAFTYASYADQVLARRLEDHPRLRAISGAGLYTLAGYIGYTRLREGQHYLTDVLAGAAAGTLIGRKYYAVNHRSEAGEDAAIGESRIRFNPPVPLPGGAMLMVSIGVGR